MGLSRLEQTGRKLIDPMDINTMWTQAEAIELAQAIEAVCPQHGCHVALTGGLLYKSGLRKDADFLFYRIRQVDNINRTGLFASLESLGVTPGPDFGFVRKAKYKGKTIDFFFPEEPQGDYNTDA